MDKPGADLALSPMDILGLYPPSFVVDLIEDDAFRAAAGFKDGMLMVLDGKARFPRRRYLGAIRALYTGANEASLEDENERTWSMRRAELQGKPALVLSSDGVEAHVRPHFVLHPDRQLRLAEFEQSLTEAGLWPDALAPWRSILEERPLDDDELRHYQLALENTPTALARKLESELQGPLGSTELIAPQNRGYFDMLIGPGVAVSLEDLAKTIVAPQVERLLACGNDGARMALLLSVQSSLLAESPLVDLLADDLAALIAWATTSGDLFSRIGAVETGLAALSRCPELERPLVDLVESLRDLDPSDPASRLNLLGGIVSFIGREMSRTRLLHDLPPFQQRLAIFAQASFFERITFGRIDPAHMADWAREHGLRRFYFQTLVDLRREPRWTAENITAENLKAELIGRISNAAATHSANVPPGRLHDLLFGEGEDGIPRHMIFPQSFLPGPLEGTADRPSIPLPDELRKIVDTALSSHDLRPQSLVPLINLRGIFAFDEGQVERAEELIRAAGHRFEATVDQATRYSLFAGLASLAATSRNPTLAEELRMMVRKNRIDAQEPPSLHQEFGIALVAAAAHPDLDAWCRFVGDWGMELAMVAGKDDAENLLAVMDLLCTIEPRLRRRLGCAISALLSFADGLA
jgi:hypothetical protein